MHYVIWNSSQYGYVLNQILHNALWPHTCFYSEQVLLCKTEWLILKIFSPEMLNPILTELTPF